MGKQLYRKFVVVASDYDKSKPHLKAEGYRFEQVLKLGQSMSMAARGTEEVQRLDAQGQPVTVAISEVFVDTQGNEYYEDGSIVPNLDAHNFTIQKRGYLPVDENDVPRPAQIFIPVRRSKDEEAFGQSLWKLRATSEGEIAGYAASSAAKLEAQAAELRERAEALRRKGEEAEQSARKQLDEKDQALKAAQLEAAQKDETVKRAQAEAAEIAEENRKLREQLEKAKAAAAKQAKKDEEKDEKEAKAK